MNPNGRATGGSAALVQTLVRLGRFVIFLCTFGWAFPHVCTEDLDLTAIQNEHTGGKRQQR
jgi:hypothetical protein